MKNVKNFLCLSLSLALLSLSALSLASCATEEKNQVLRVYNWEDYISDEDDEEEGCIDLIAAFEEEYDVTVEYSTFGTNENMYNELRINSGNYDLVCPSDYMIMKMIQEDMCEAFTEDFLTEYNSEGEYNYYYNGASPYIKDLFQENGWSAYAAAYMWGTMGFLYDPEAVGEDLLTKWIDENNLEWTDLNDETLAHKFTLKDSVRDTYFLAVAYVYHDELVSLAEAYRDGQISTEAYTNEIASIMNRTDEKTVTDVQSSLRELKKRAYGFEVDSGKNDIVTGKISVNFCWSGDAAYSIYEAAEENDKILYYSVPSECTNIWFDGWVIPKGGNVELAQKFLNFISRPSSAISNMNYVGYSSAIAGYTSDDENVESGSMILERLLASYALDEEDIDETSVEFDLSYFFGKDSEAVFFAAYNEANGILIAQYPTKEIILRSAVMQFFEEDANNRINMMWEDVKGAEIPLGAVVFIGAVAVILSGAYIFTKYGEKFVVNKPKKGYRKIER